MVGAQQRGSELACSRRAWWQIHRWCCCCSSIALWFLSVTFAAALLLTPRGRIKGAAAVQLTTCCRYFSSLAVVLFPIPCCRSCFKNAVVPLLTSSWPHCRAFAGATVVWLTSCGHGTVYIVELLMSCCCTITPLLTSCLSGPCAVVV